MYIYKHKILYSAISNLQTNLFFNRFARKVHRQGGGKWWIHHAIICVSILSIINWWRDQMETFSASLALCAGNSPATGEFPAQRPVTRSFDVFFYRCLNKRLSKQSWGWWFETPSRPLWRHSNELRSNNCIHSVDINQNDNQDFRCFKCWWPFITDVKIG